MVGTCVGLHYDSEARATGLEIHVACWIYVCDACERDVLCDCGCDLLECHRKVRFGMSKCSLHILPSTVRCHAVVLGVGLQAHGSTE